MNSCLEISSNFRHCLDSALKYRHIVK